MGTKILFLQLQVSVAVVAVLLLRQCMKKLPKVYVYVLWILVFVRLLVPVSLETRFGILPSETESAAWMEENLQTAAFPMADAGEDGKQGLTDGKKEASDMAAELPGTDKGDRDAAVRRGGQKQDGADLKGTEEQSKLPIVCLVVWALGAAGILGYNGVALARIRRILRNAVQLQENIFLCKGIHEPFTLGLLRARIYLPVGLGEEERRYIICHEKVHIGRKDYLVKNIAFLLTAIYWFNPFIWIAFRFLERDMEMSCDEKVIKLLGADVRKQYSQSLLNFAERREHMAVTPLTFGENNTKQRVKNVLSRKNTKWWGVGAGVAVLCAAGAVLFTTRAGGESEDAQTADAGQGQQTASGLLSGEDGLIPENLPDQEAHGIPEMANPPGEPDTVAHTTPEETADNWAYAFCSRYRNNLKELALDKEAFESWNLANVETEGLITFGWVEPWAYDHEYTIQWTEKDTEAVIRYYMDCSEPGVRYVADERVRLVERDGLYYIEHQELQLYDNLSTRSEFEALYGEAGDCDFGYTNTGWRNWDFWAILANMENGGIYEQYRDPVTAAAALLHLGEGTGKIVGEQTLPLYYTVLSDGETHFGDMATDDLPGWLLASSESGEGSGVTVQYTFAEDGSSIEFPMYLIEGSAGIWAPDISFVRGWYASRRMEAAYSGEEQDFYIQTGKYGIYRLDAEGLRCLYPGHIPAEQADVFDVYDGKLYFPGDSQYGRDSLDYWADSIFVLDMTTGALDTETYRLPQEAQGMTGSAAWLSVRPKAGFLSLYSDSAGSYHIPLVNIQETVYDNKTIVQLTEREKDRYGSANREAILGHRDTLMDFSIRDYEETSAYIDLDGDGAAEKISITAAGKDGCEYPYDHYLLQVGEESMEGWGECLNNGIWAYSPDGKRIILALYEDGPSSDPYTTLFEYAAGELKALGGFGDDIRSCRIKDGIISGTQRQDVQQTDWIYADWRVTETAVELVRQETYDFTAQNEITLLVKLPVHDSPSQASPSHMLEPQTIKFLRTDGSFSWIYAEGEDGDGGWFEAGWTVPELGMNYFEVFENLSLTD